MAAAFLPMIRCQRPSLILAGQARVKVLRSNDSWFGVTYREDHASVVESIQRLIKAGKYPERLWS